MSRSNVEPEYRVMTHTTCEMMWQKSLLWELRFSVDDLLPMYCNKQAAIYIATNHAFHEDQAHRGGLLFCS